MKQLRSTRAQRTVNHETNRTDFSQKSNEAADFAQPVLSRQSGCSIASDQARPVLRAKLAGLVAFFVN